MTTANRHLRSDPRPSNQPKKLNILMVPIRFPEVSGGVDTMVHELIAGLAPHATVTVFAPGTWDQARLETRRVGEIVCHAMRLRMPFDRRRPIRGFLGFLWDFPHTLTALIRLVRSARIDVIHLHTATSHNAIFRLVSWLTGVPYVTTLHGSDVTALSKRRWEERVSLDWGLYGSARIVAVSRALATLARQNFPRLGAVEVIYNGIDLAAADGSHSRPRSPGRARLFLSVGALDWVKGHDVLIRAWSHIVGEMPGARLVIVGDGEEKAILLRLIADLSCAATVELSGVRLRPDVLALMRQADVFVLPSRYEGLGYVLLEAGMAELPVIATAVGGIPEVLEDGESGILVRPEDPKALADAIRRVVADGDLRRRLGANLRRAAETRFSVDAMVDGYVKLFSTLRKEG